MNCETALRQLGPAKGPRPEGPASDEAWAHLAECASCQAVYARQAALAKRLAAFGRGYAPEGLRAAVSESLRRGAGATHAIRSPRRWAWASALAAAAVVTIMAVTRFGGGNALAAPLAAAAQAAIEPQAMLVSQDPDQIEQWIEHQLGYHVAVPMITNATLEGARVTSVAKQRSAAVVYRSRGEPVTYFALAEGEVFGRSVRSDQLVSGRSGDYEVALWTENGQVRAIAAPMTRPEVVDMANECRSKAATD